jgi:thioredoxin 1
MKIEVNDDSFTAEVIESDIPVLVDFWAEWCMPCKMVMPVIDEISEEYAGRLKVCSVNVDEARNTAGEYNVMSIPTLAVFQGGELVDRVVGAVPKDMLLEKITPYLK